MGNRTMVDCFGTSIAYERCLIQACAAFLLEIRTGLVTGWAGGTFYTAQDDLVADVGLPAVITVDTKVMSIVKRAFVIPVTESVQLNFLGDGSRILTEKSCDILKGFTFIQRPFNVLSVFQSQMLLVARYIFAHKSLLLLLSEGT